jgi:hypothetical protein
VTTGMGTAYKFSHRNAGGELLWASKISDSDFAELKGLEARFGRTPELDMLVAEAQTWQHNALLDDGENNMLDVYFRSNAAPASFYFALVNSTPAETITMATLSGEVTGTGYARIAVARNTTDWAAPTLSTDYSTTSVTKTFTAGGTWTSAITLMLVTSASGTTGLALASAALSATRTLVNGDTLATSMTVTQS